MKTKVQRKNLKSNAKFYKQEKGITLIALVVTIVVLLILAGVSISLVLNNNGVISKAKDAKNQYAEAKTNEEKQLAETSDWIEETVTNVNKIEGVVIPEGYYYVGGTKAKGIVISDNANDNELDKGKNNVRRDLDGNQWVWVPVETPSSLYTTVDEGVLLAGSTEVKTTKYTNSEIIREQTRGLPGSTIYREPDILTLSGCDKTNYATVGFSSYATMTEIMKSDYEEMIKSIEKYKGFYIGRYELSENGEKTGNTQRDINWYELYKNCTKCAKEGTNVKTRMIWGLQWDATCNWLASSGFSMTDSTKWGNYVSSNVSIKNTGYSESWKANNIYDFAGNCFEWTQEAQQIGGRVIRGAEFDNEEFRGKGTASSRDSFNPTNEGYKFGTRPTLYLIP